MAARSARAEHSAADGALAGSLTTTVVVCASAENASEAATAATNNEGNLRGDFLLRIVVLHILESGAKCPRMLKLKLTASHLSVYFVPR